MALQPPVGANVVPEGGVRFRVWAPDRKSVEVMIAGEPPQYYALERERRTGYFSGLVRGAGPGTLYKYRLDGGASYPDPASRFQPCGPHTFSQVVDPWSFAWSDHEWPGLKIEGQVSYEMHIGTFTREGTWKAAMEQLPYLADLGITAIEVMPVNEFPGTFGWGYDGVHPFAPTHLYGTADDFRHFVDRAHQLKLGVILDVVYNHLGPDGNYFGQFSPYYFTSRHHTDWGEALNFDGSRSRAVREFFIANAGYWIREFHVDGLRLDATHCMIDDSRDHILAAITREVRLASEGRDTIVIGENEPMDRKLVTDYGMDALWNDDLHRAAMVRLTGNRHAYFAPYSGTVQELISAARHGFLRHSPDPGMARSAYVNFLQNHDQVSNAPDGQRVQHFADPQMYRAMTALVLLMPGTPMLFQGEEFGASSPFPFFADHHQALATSVREGRSAYLSRLKHQTVPDPHDRVTFESAILDFRERERSPHRETLQLVREVLRLRKHLDCSHGLDGAVLSDDAFVLRYFGRDGVDHLICVNFGSDAGEPRATEPLLVPPQGSEWQLIWASEASGPHGVRVLKPLTL